MSCASDARLRSRVAGRKPPAIPVSAPASTAYHDGEVTLYAESKDGITWTRPNLGLFEHPSFPEGNIVLMNEFTVNHNFTPFIDTKPGVPADQKYKALGGLAFQPHQSAVREKRGIVFEDGDAWHPGVQQVSSAGRKRRPNAWTVYSRQDARRLDLRRNLSRSLAHARGTDLADGYRQGPGGHAMNDRPLDTPRLDAEARSYAKAIALRFVKDDTAAADDIAQDAMLLAHRHLGS